MNQDKPEVAGQGEILEGNKLIAEFHGWQPYKAGKGTGKTWWHFQAWGKGAFDAESFRYHTSWDWIMPVVGKIEEMAYELRKDAAECSFHHFASGNYFVESGAGIKALWKLVVKFIKYYNSNQP